MFRELGIKKGDRIVSYMPNCIENIVLCLTCASMGVVWSSCSPEFGIDATLDRFSQISPVLLISVDGYLYTGKSIPLENKVKTISEKIPSIKKTIIIPFLDETYNIKSENTILWNDFISINTGDHQFKIELVPFNYPLYIMYSSGTTGKPKCIIHGHGATFLQHMKEHQLHTDIHENDKVFYFSTCGWMMWNWLVSVLASGACAVLFDGSPFHPKPNVLWNIAEKEKLSVFGTSAKYISYLNKLNYHPIKHHNLDTLKFILSTGSPLLPESFDFVYERIKKDVCLSSISGGTDIISCFVLGNPMLPVYRGEIQCRGLGMDVHFVNSAGKICVETKGELICKTGFPSMPVGFWNDDSKETYQRTYFKKARNIWEQGDYGMLTNTGGVILYGRADSTLNPGGIRMGTAEIYRQVEQITEIVESLAIGLKRNGDEEIVLFVILQSGLVLDQELKKLIKKQIKVNASPRHVPHHIVQTQDFPRTLNGKISEFAVKCIIHKQPLSNASALANPEVLKTFSELNFT